jgi:hypothetical protein
VESADHLVVEHDLLAAEAFALLACAQHEVELAALSNEHLSGPDDRPRIKVECRIILDREVLPRATRGVTA